MREADALQQRLGVTRYLVGDATQLEARRLERIEALHHTLEQFASQQKSV